MINGLLIFVYIFASLSRSRSHWMWRGELTGIFDVFVASWCLCVFVIVFRRGLNILLVSNLMDGWLWATYFPQQCHLVGSLFEWGLSRNWLIYKDLQGFKLIWISSKLNVWFVRIRKSLRKISLSFRNKLTIAFGSTRANIKVIRIDPPRREPYATERRYGFNERCHQFSTASY